MLARIALLAPLAFLIGAGLSISQEVPERAEYIAPRIEREVVISSTSTWAGSIPTAVTCGIGTYTTIVQSNTQ